MTDKMPTNERIEALSDKLDREHTDNVQRLTGLEAGQVQIKDKLVDQKEVLVKMDVRISNLEKWMWRATGAIAIGFGVVNVVLMILQYTKK